MLGNTVGKPESSVPHAIAANRVICMSEADADLLRAPAAATWSDGGPMPDRQMAVPSVCLSGPNLALTRLAL